MSHNTPKVGTATQDRAGALSTSLTDLSDVSGSPSVSDLMEYGGAGWLPVSAPIAGQSTEVVTWVGGAHVGYSVGYSNFQPAVGGWYRLSLCYPPSYFDFRPLYYQDGVSAVWVGEGGADAFTTPDWLNRVRLAANGTYIIYAKHMVFGGTGTPFVDVQWQTATGDAAGPIRRISGLYDVCTVRGAIKTGASSETLGLKIIAKSSTGVLAPDSVSNGYLQISIIRIA